MKKKLAVTILIGCMAAGIMTGCAELKNAGVLEADAAATLKMAKNNKTGEGEDASTLTTENTEEEKAAADQKNSDDEPMTLESTEKDQGSQVTVAADAATLTVTGSGTATVTPDKAFPLASRRWILLPRRHRTRIPRMSIMSLMS